MRLIRRRLLAWGRRHYKDYPWRSEETPWLALAAEVLLQRTRAAQVAPVYEEFRRRYSTPDHLAAETPRGLRSTIGSLGLHWRAPLMIEMAATVADRGTPPDSESELTKLPGVGPYAAAAYRSLHRGQRSVLIDANVVRWLGRVFGFKTDAETRRKRWVIDLADQLTPIDAFRDYNYSVLDFTMAVCARKPKCSVCPLAADRCVYAAKGRRELGPGTRLANQDLTR